MLLDLGATTFFCVEVVLTLLSGQDLAIFGDLEPFCE
jgi:hypothetical protein